MNQDQNSESILFWLAIATGLATSVLAIVVYENCGSLANACVLDGLNNWQTLVGSSLATAAAAITVVLIRSQIRQSEQHESMRRKNSLNSARALLPGALVEIQAYADRCLKHMQWEEEYKEFKSKGKTFKKANVAAPEFPFSAEIRISDIIGRVMPDMAAAGQFVEILNLLQVQNSRINSYRAFNRILRYNIFVNTMELTAVCDQGFPFGRFESEDFYLSDEKLGELNLNIGNFRWPNSFVELKHSIGLRSSILSKRRK